MTATAGYFHDAALTRQVTSNDPLRPTLSTDSSAPTVDKLIYLGSPATGKRLRAASNPGTDNLITSLTDAYPTLAPGVSVCKLAASSNGLATATAGAPLDHGITSLLSGVAHALPIYLRFGPYATPGQWTEIVPTCCQLLEDAAP